jgi:hypothetical protein
MKISILFAILFMFCISFAAHSVKHDESLSDTGRTENMSEINMPLLIPQNFNDKWMGDFYHATDRTKSRNLVEEGRFYGVQQGARVIGLYAPGGLRLVSSAKAALIWTQRELVDEIWVGDRRVGELPAEVAQDEIVVIGSGGTLMAVRPLARTDLGLSSAYSPR